MAIITGQCDGARPVCKCCTFRRFSCSYDVDPGGREPSKLRQKLKGVGFELDQLKALLLPLALTSSRDDVRRAASRLRGIGPEALIEELLKIFPQDIPLTSTSSDIASPTEAWSSQSMDVAKSLPAVNSIVGGLPFGQSFTSDERVRLYQALQISPRLFCPSVKYTYPISSSDQIHSFYNSII